MICSHSTPFDPSRPICECAYGPIRCRLREGHDGAHEGQRTSKHAIVTAIWTDDADARSRFEEFRAHRIPVTN